MGIYDLGLSEAQFWELTPALLNILCRRKYANDRRELSNAALITTAILNVNRPKNKRAYKIEDVIGKDLTDDNREEMCMSDLIKKLHRRRF